MNQLMGCYVHPANIPRITSHYNYNDVQRIGLRSSYGQNPFPHIGKGLVNKLKCFLFFTKNILHTRRLKGQCHEIFECQFFSSNSSSWSPQRYPGTLLIFTKNSRRYSNLKSFESIKRRTFQKILSSYLSCYMTKMCISGRFIEELSLFEQWLTSFVQQWPPLCILHR